MPDWRSEIRSRLASLKLPPEREAEIVEEVAQHMEDRFRESRTTGGTDAQAEATAWRELESNETLRRELTAVERRLPPELPPPGSQNRGRWLEALFQDFRFAGRTLRKNPGFTWTVVVALALSIGPTTAIISFGNWLLWRPIPGVTTDRIAQVWFGRWSEGGGVSPSGVSYANMADIAARSKTMMGWAGVQESAESLSVQGALPRIAGVGYVTSGFFDVLGVRMTAGRGFLSDEDLPPLVSPVAVISDGLARAAFGSPGNAIGRQLVINSRPFTVIGVTPAGFAGITTTSRVEIWISGATLPYLRHLQPGARPDSRGDGVFYSFVARVSPPYGFRELESELGVLTRGLAEVYPKENSKFKTVTPRVFPGLGLYVLMRARMGTMINMLLAIGGILLLLSCANVSNLLVLRATRREHEIALRKTFGAGRFRLVQLQLAESWLLAICGAALGILLALILARLLQELLFPMPPGTSVSLPIDWRVLGATLGIASATGGIAGTAPAWFAARGRLAGMLGRSGMRSSAHAPRLRSLLAMFQLALSLTLLIGAVMLVSTLRNLRSVDLGFDAANVTTLNVDLASHGYDINRALIYLRELHSALEAGGGFQEVTIAQLSPFGSGSSFRILPPGADPKNTMSVRFNGVTHTFFRALSVPLVRGRPFTAEESFTSGAPPAVPIIINEILARRLFGTIDVWGRTIRKAAALGSPERELVVVGVARDSRWNNVTGQPDPFLYMPLGQNDFPATRAAIMIRSVQPAAKVAEAVRSAAARIDASVPLSGGQPLTASIDRSLREQRLFAWTLSLLGGLGFLLAAVGLYGLVSQIAVERSREFGIRLALGARRLDIVRLVFRSSLVIAAGGTATGLALAFFGSRAIKSMLFGVTNTEPWIYASAVVTLGFIVVLACVAPAFRATRVQPVEILRSE